MLLSFKAPSPVRGPDLIKRKAPANKKWHPKVRSGCVRCKIRKIKCDEQIPECLRCRKSGFKCGYDVPKPKVFTIDDGLKFDNPEDKRFYDFFINEGSALLATFQPSTLQFWVKLAPQLSRTNPAVQYGLTALGALQAPLHYAVPRDALQTSRPQLSSTALVYMVKAMNDLVNANPTSVGPEVSLTCCLCFTAIAIWTEKVGAPVVHIDAGLRILQEYRKKVKKDPLQRNREMEEGIAWKFEALVVNACAFSDNYPNSTSNIPSNYALDLGLDSSGYLLNFPDAMDALSTILKCIFRLNEGQTAEAINEKVEGALMRFSSSLDELHERDVKTSVERGRPGAINLDTLLQLRIHYRVAYVMFHAQKAGDEMDYDLFQNDFTFILDQCRIYLARAQEQHAGQPGNLQTILGSIPPLFFTATKCRDSTTRWQALELLHNSLRTERGWTSCMATTLAEFVITTEEAGLFIPQPKQVPIENRIDLKQVSHSSADCLTSIQFRYCVDNEATPERTVTLPFMAHATVEKDGSTFPMARKVLRACGYTGVLFFAPRITCHCTGNVKRSLSIRSLSVASGVSDDHSEKPILRP